MIDIVFHRRRVDARLHHRALAVVDAQRYCQRSPAWITIATAVAPVPGTARTEWHVNDVAVKLDRTQRTNRQRCCIPWVRARGIL